VTGSCDPKGLWETIQDLAEENNIGTVDVALVVHYSGYGYAPHGAPEWLADALEAPPAFAAGRIVTMFHELYATGWPWRRAFWYSPRQRAVAIRIARASDTLMTNREQSARWLERGSGRLVGSVLSLPITSNVGEPGSVPPWGGRPPRAVAFGGVRNKQFLCGTSAKATARLLKRLEIAELFDIGQPAVIRRAAFERCGIRVRQLGYCTTERVSEVLLESRIGLLDYPFAFLGKSGVLAAYAAHGLAILNAARKKEPADGHAIPVYSSDSLAIEGLPTMAELASAGERARNWYLPHQSSDHARAMLQLSGVSVDGVRV
jgi:hypothetical protein